MWSLGRIDITQVGIHTQDKSTARLRTIRVFLRVGAYYVRVEWLGE